MLKVHARLKTIKRFVILLLCSVDYFLKRVSKLNKEFVYKERRNLIFTSHT